MPLRLSKGWKPLFKRSMKVRRRKILIIGAGLVGSLIGYRLSQRGYSVTILERREDLRNSAISAGRSINLALAERGREALRQAGLLSLVEPHLVAMRGRMLHESSGDPRFQPYGQHPEEVIYSISRGVLNRILLTAAEGAGADIQFRTTCERIDLSTKEVWASREPSRVESQLSFDLVLGADGAGSILRDAILERSGQVGVLEELGHAYKELTLEADGNGRHRLEPHALHIWPRGGYMLIALPNPDGSFTLTLFLPREGTAASFAELQLPQNIKRFFSEQFPDIASLMVDLSTQFLTNPIGKLATLRCWPWAFEDQALVLGDAAHAIVPFHGQGMNCGFEDCQVLIRLLDEFKDDWPTVIPMFCQSRKPNADAIADLALKNYEVMRDQVRDSKFHLRQEIEFELERRWPRRYIPKYAMVMFHHVPYAQALERGAIQEQLMNDLMHSATSIDDIDFIRADQWIAENLTEPPGLAQWKG